MRRYRFLQLDVFTHEPFGGNQLAAFTNAAGLSDGEMQAIAREMNFSETVFVLPARDVKALRRLRIFTPGAELPVAGHPTVGSIFALAAEGVIRASETSPIYLELGVGTLPIDVLFEGDRLSFAWMHQPIPEFTPWPGDLAALLASIGLDEGDLDPTLPIERGSAGVPFLYIPVRSPAALGRAQPGTGLRAALADPTNQLCAYLFTLDGVQGANARSRMFAPAVGIAEDAATGIAAGPFGVYLLRHGQVQPDDVGETRLRIEQGVEMGRASRIAVALSGTPERVQDVRVGGESVLVAEGTFFLP